MEMPHPPPPMNANVSDVITVMASEYEWEREGK